MTKNQKAETSLGSQLQLAITRLESHSPSPRVDAELLLAYALAKPRSYLYAWPEQMLTEAELRAYANCIECRACGEPVAHLTGRREFWSLDLEVTAATLVPRPETEGLVESALERIPTGAHWQLADLGTGTGAVALAIATERPVCRVLASDISMDALTVACRNARRLQIPNVDFVHGNWLAGCCDSSLDMVMCNPPYVAEADPCLVSGDLRFEPARALASGSEGLDDLHRVITGAVAALRPGGWLLLEHGADQGEAVRALLDASGYTEVATARDLAGHERISAACRD